MSDPVVVVGGAVAAMAAAARLAKKGHPVTLVESADELGGPWAAYEVDGEPVDDAPCTLGFPAPWRDLFRKSGRPLEAELARSGWALVPAASRRYRFADGDDLVLPTERGQQFATLERHYGEPVAARWRDLVDGLAPLWQTLRPLGLEAEYVPIRRFGRSVGIDRPTRRSLQAARTVAELADRVDHPHLRAVIRSLAHRLGSPPETVPWFTAVELWTDRTFGRWQLSPVEGSAADRPGSGGPGAGRSSVLIETLAGRLTLRRVTIRTGTTLDRLEIDSGRVSGARAGGVDHPATTVVSALDPWSTAALAGLAPPRQPPALAPAISHAVLDQAPGEVGEDIALTADGVPAVTFTRPLATGTLRSVHDWTTTHPAPAEGLSWQGGWRAWAGRPALRTGIEGLLQVGPWSTAGPGPAQQVLTGALAAYAVDGPDA